MGKKYVVAARLDEKAYDYVNRLCREGGVSVSECLRRIIESSQKNRRIYISSPESYAQGKEMIREINRIGVNINQIVRGMNTGFYSKDEKARLEAYMRKILETVTDAAVPD